MLSGSEMIGGFLLLQKPAPSLPAWVPLLLGPAVSGLFSLQTFHKTAALKLKILKCSLVLFTSLPWFIMFFPSLTPFLFPSWPMLQNPPFFMFQYICFMYFQGREGGRPYNIPTATDSTHRVILTPPCSLPSAPTAVLLSLSTAGIVRGAVLGTTPMLLPRPIKSKSLWLGPGIF